MMASEHIIEVTEADFEYQVLAFSQKTPVVVDFWAEWCVPCKTLGPLLEKLTQEAHGAFRLAKVDVDQNQTLAMRYNVRSIPTVKAFRNGAVVSEFVGLRPEPALREFLSELAPSAADLALEKANSMLTMEQYTSAEAAFRDVLEITPGRPAALLGLAKSLLFQGQTEAASRILRGFPASREFNAAQSLLPLIAALERVENGDAWSDDPLDAAYNRAIKLVRRGNVPAAIDGLMDVLRQDKRYRDGAARQVILSLLELLGEDNPLTRQYRQELAMVLF
jgi:putative thioredoxin